VPLIVVHTPTSKLRARERVSVHTGIHQNEVSDVFAAQKTGRHIVPVGHFPCIVRALPKGDKHPMREVAGLHMLNRLNRVDD
jgi:hypothetical protein